MSSSKLSAPEIKGALAHLRSLLEFNYNKRPWGFLLTVSSAAGLPVVIATWLCDISAGLLASMAGLSSVYLRQPPLSHRLFTMWLVTFAFCASFVISVVAGFSTWGAVPAVAGVAFWATFICRYFFIPAPGSFFFILVACIATATPFDLTLLTERAGLLLLGCLGASALVLIYSLIQRLGNRIVEVSPRITTEPRSVAIALEAGTIAIFIAGSYLLALQMGLEKPYWAPISCAAIMQGATFRTIWQRNVHRVVGTGIGMGLAWSIFSLSPEPWVLAGMVIVLSFCIDRKSVV